MGLTATETVVQPKAMQSQCEMFVESCHEGPSRPKNKGPDSKEWGNVQLDKNKMDAALQQAAYESYKEQDQYKDQWKKCACHQMSNRDRGQSQ